MKRLSIDELGVGIGNFNILTTFAVRYALGRDTTAAGATERILRDSLEGLHEQTKSISFKIPIPYLRECWMISSEMVKENGNERKPCYNNG